MPIARTARRIARSPLAVVGTAAALAVAWTFVWEAFWAPSPVAAEDGAEGAEAERSAQVAESAAASALGQPGIVRRGPRLLQEPDPEVPGLPIAIEDRDGRSMEGLHAALREAERGTGQARLVFYGASHVASDLFTGVIRHRLQERFGDAGHGMILPAHPWRTYRHLGARMQSNRRLWDSSKVRVNMRDPDFFGVAGTFVESARQGAWGRVATADRGPVGRTASRFDLYYLQRPEGGSFEVALDGEVVRRVETGRDDGYAPGYLTLDVPDAEHELEVRVEGDGPVRFFGVAMERDAPGVIVDTLGIYGARARYHLLGDDQLYREHLRRRQPNLVALAYGTNEAGDDVPIERYEQELRAVLGRIRETVPEASCLLIGPSDRPVRRPDRSFEDRPRTGQIIEVQHRVALEMGCGFFDLVAFSGGPLSMVEWAAMDPRYGQPDHVHYTRRGYHRLGEVLLDALLAGYDPDAE